MVLGAAQFAFGVFIIPLEEEFGWSRTQVNGALSLGVLSALLAPLAGWALDRFGARWVMGISLAIVSLGFYLRATSNELWQFYLFSAIVFAGTAGVTNIPAGRLVSLWFARTRGRMMGLVTSGNNFGGMVAVPLVAALIASSGWRNGFFAIGVAMTVTMVLVVLVVRDKPEDVEREAGKRWAPAGAGDAAAVKTAREGMSPRDAMRRHAFWLIMAGMALQQFARTVIATQMVPHLEQEGFSTGEAAAAVSGLAFMAMSSKIIFGGLSEKMTALYAYATIIAIQIIGLVTLIFAPADAALWVGVLVFGLGMGGVGALGPLAVAETFGMRHMGAIQGLISFAVIIPTVTGPIMAGQVYDRTGDYQLAFLITAALLTVSLFAFFSAGYWRERAPVVGAVS
jgi:MFS family permease